MVPSAPCANVFDEPVCRAVQWQVRPGEKVLLELSGYRGEAQPAQPTAVVDRCCLLLTSGECVLCVGCPNKRQPVAAAHQSSRGGGMGADPRVQADGAEIPAGAGRRTHAWFTRTHASSSRMSPTGMRAEGRPGSASLALGQRVEDERSCTGSHHPRQLAGQADRGRERRFRA